LNLDIQSLKWYGESEPYVWDLGMAFETRKRYIKAALLATPIAVVLAMFSTGAGHGNYLFCKIFFPYTMLSTHFFEQITIPFIIIGLVQLPLYGIVLELAARKSKLFLALAGIVLSLFHAIAVGLCFFIPMPNFS